MYSYKIFSMFTIFLMTSLFHLYDSTPNNILAIYEKSFYFEMENGSLDEKPDDEGESGSVLNSIPYSTALLSRIPEQPDNKLQFHLVTVFYQGSYI
ncbi:hypothetical protein AB685_01095 [Bacillus sp. LL01]|uniref:hypothetical protein n=1 Tax=Bacillus sp. LL01 TaxID=1665556 RepID=UPI00064D135D|nr:hypothetical protein [Bacillus sp. LL01]KMJ59505.1 hypothetical protein AB685_01095 [Bacillus sp. LL01]